MSFQVLIPSRNAANLVACLAAIRRNEGDVPVIVVDDGVEWGCVPAYSHLHRVAGEKPFCFARNVNLGIKAALEDPKCDGIVLLNDDATLETMGGFSLLSHTARSLPAYGLIAACCNNVGNRNQFPKKTNQLRDDPRMVCFTCVLIPRATVEIVGLLDERFIGYGMEDDDYCLRVRRTGLKIGIHDGCFVDHSKLHSSFRGPQGRGGDYRPNLKLFVEKWGFDNWGRPAKMAAV